MPTLEAFAWGIVAGSSVLLGAAVALRRPPPTRLLGLMMGFGAGVLISALAYDLVAKAFAVAEDRGIWIGLVAGAVAFYLGDMALERWAPNTDAQREWYRGRNGSIMGIVVFEVVFSRIPESVVVGLSLLSGHGVSPAVVVAVFLATLPDAIASTAGLSHDGMRRSRILLLWTGTLLVSGLASVAGYELIGATTPAIVALVLAFAAGIVLNRLTNAMVPEAAQLAGRAAGLATTLGFAVAFLVVTLEVRLI